MASFDINRRYSDIDDLDDLEFTSEDSVRWQHLHRDPFFGLPRVGWGTLRDYLYWRDVAGASIPYDWQYDYLLPEHNVAFYLHVGGNESGPWPEQREFFQEFTARFGEFKGACDNHLREVHRIQQPAIPSEPRTEIEMTLYPPRKSKVGWQLYFYTMISQDFCCHAEGLGLEITLMEFGY